MKVFTYNQYIKYIHQVRLNTILQLAEEGEEYNIESKSHIYDKLMKNILKNKNETTMLINNFLKPKEKIGAEQLVKYTNSYINKKYKTKEIDWIYKLRGKEIFFLIKHQSTIDNQMPYRILNYCIDIIQGWNRNRRIRKNTLYPLIVPIVIYTGNRKWKVTRNLKYKQVGDYIFERHNINLEYNLIDINKISKKILLENNNMFCNIMLIEKSKNKKDLKNNLIEIIKTTKDKEKLDELADIIIYILDSVLENKEQEKLLENINKKIGDEKMSTLIDRLTDENKRMIKLGISQNKKQVVENMIKINLKDEIILKSTGIEREELEKIKNKMIKSSQK